MIDALKKILQEVLHRLALQVDAYLPSVLAGLVILAGAYVAAGLTRWLIHRIFKGRAIDRFLRQSGLAFMLDASGRLRATRVVAGAAYWAILAAGILSAISAWNTDLTTRMVQGFVLLLPKLLVAGMILVAGAWLSQYLGRGILVWAVNEDLPSPRRLAAVVRTIVMFVTIVVTADHLDFARSVFLWAFVLLVGGVVLTASLALGLGGSEAVRSYLKMRNPAEVDSRERSLWNQL